MKDLSHLTHEQLNVADYMRRDIDSLLRSYMHETRNIVAGIRQQSDTGSHPATAQSQENRSSNHGIGRHVHQDWESSASGISAFTVGPYSTADVVTVAEEVITKSVARGIHFDPDPSLVLGTIVVTHEENPRFVPVRAKYDTGSEVNIVPIALVEKNGLLEFLVELEAGTFESKVYGLNDQEFIIHHTISLQWSAATMRNVRTTRFHVADASPYDMLLGNPFIQENKVFDPQRVALPLRHGPRSSGENAPTQTPNFLLTYPQPSYSKKKRKRKPAISQLPRKSNE